MTVRLSVNLNDDSAAVLKDLAAKREMSVTEVVRRAISVYKFIDEELVERKRTMQLLEPDSDRPIEVALV